MKGYSVLSPILIIYISASFYHFFWFIIKNAKYKKKHFKVQRICSVSSNTFNIKLKIDQPVYTCLSNNDYEGLFFTKTKYTLVIFGTGDISVQYGS